MNMCVVYIAPETTMDDLDSVEYECRRGTYITQYLNYYKQQYISTLDVSTFQKYQKLAEFVLLHTSVMMKALCIQIETYHKVDRTTTSRNNISSLVDFYNELSILNAVCATFIFEIDLDVDIMNIKMKYTYHMTAFPRDAVFAFYIKSEMKRILTDTKITKGCGALATCVTINCVELGRLLLRRKLNINYRYTKDYLRLSKQCIHSYSNLIQVSEIL